MTTASEKIYKNDSLLDIMIRLEDFIDSLDIYAYKNWIDGEIVDGPDVSRYWASFTLRWDYEKMPDPEGGLRLLKHGAEVKYEKAEEEDAEFHIDTSPENLSNISTASYGQNDQYGSSNVPSSYLWKDLKKKPVWLVHISIPRRFIDDAFDMDVGLMVAKANSKSALIDKSFAGDWSDDSPPRPATRSNEHTGLAGE